MPRVAVADGPVTLYGLISDLFIAFSITCFLLAMHRIATGLRLGARITAMRKLEDEFTPEECELVIHRIKKEAVRY
jgi:hypothetical protein